MTREERIADLSKPVMTRIQEMFLSDEERGFSPQWRKMTDDRNERYHEIFYEPWKAYVKPFKIAGNVYYIGLPNVSMHLIDTGDGLIVYDAGFQHTLPLMVKAIYELGFDPNDIKYVFITHGHFDHYGSAAWIQGLYGAKIVSGALDHGIIDIPRFGTIPRPDYSLDGFEPDILVHTGDEITLGSVTLKVYENPGHAWGAITTFMDTEEDGRPLRVCFYGDAGPMTVGEELRSGSEFGKLCLQVRQRTNELLAEEHADVFVAGHPGMYRCFEKLAEREKTGVNAFINPNDFKEFYQRELDAFNRMMESFK